LGNVLKLRSYTALVSPTTPTILGSSRFDPAQCARGGRPLASLHQSMEDSMTLDIIMAVIAVTVMFTTIAIVLGWEEYKTRHR